MKAYWKEQAAAEASTALRTGNRKTGGRCVAFSQWMMVAVCYGRGKQAIILHKIRQWSRQYWDSSRKCIMNEWMKLPFKGQKRIEIKAPEISVEFLTKIF